MSEGKLFSGIIVGILAVMVIVIVFAVRAQNEWNRWCESQGGHVVSNTTTGTVVVVGTNGQPGVGTATSTTYYCLSADGRILGITS